MHLILSRFLAKRGVKDEILMFDAHSVTPEVRESVEQLLKSKAQSFDQKANFFFFVISISATFVLKVLLPA